LIQLAAGFPAARRILERFQPDALFFTGGYVGVPVAIAGRNRPQAVFVPDVEPGLALRLISRFADLITVSTEASKEFYADDKNVLVTGYPTRPSMQPISKQDARSQLDLDPDYPVVLVFGGSRGARSINEALWGSLTHLLEHCQVLHITGELDWPRVPGVGGSLSEKSAARYRPEAYLHEDMALAMSAADLVVSRAGAATMGEFPRFGLPAILVPYPHAWRYQATNAEYLTKAGGAITLLDEQLHNSLADKVLELLRDDARLQNMRTVMRSLDQPGAAKRIAEAILALVSSRSGRRG
jgi:UDP-N-acetylglucosamine--N-acetylmuramyl-(pentapeptide) pyrophosphoryl-undecaprenol N-acetylglucosamine transferase